MTMWKRLIVLFVLWGIPNPVWPSPAHPATTPLGMTMGGQELQPRNPLGPEGAQNAPIALLGIVVAVDERHGSLVLEHGDGTRTDLDVQPTLLRKVQVGDPVKVVAEGSVVRTLEPLDPFARPA